MNAQETAWKNVLENARNEESYTGRFLTFFDQRITGYRRAARFWFVTAVIGNAVWVLDVWFTNGAPQWWVVLPAFIVGVVGGIGFFQCRFEAKMARTHAHNAALWVELGRRDVERGTFKVVQ